jgi:hypothetical protein
VELERSAADQQKTVHCDRHGDRPEANVCDHLLHGTRQGFFAGDDAGNPYPWPAPQFPHKAKYDLRERQELISKSRHTEAQMIGVAEAVGGVAQGSRGRGERECLSTRSMP